MSVIMFNNLIGPILVSIVISEKHTSSIGITENPIETGASITDHAYIKPKQYSVDFGDANAAETYNALVKFQETREPFTIVSGLFVYKNMLIENISVTRDSTYAYVLNGNVDMKEAILVSTAYTASEGDSGSAKSKGKAGGNKSAQSARPSKETAGDAKTADRASGTNMRGDTAATNVSTPRTSWAKTIGNNISK